MRIGVSLLLLLCALGICLAVNIQRSGAKTSLKMKSLNLLAKDASKIETLLKGTTAEAFMKNPAAFQQLDDYIAELHALVVSSQLELSAFDDDEPTIAVEEEEAKLLQVSGMLANIEPLALNLLEFADDGPEGAPVKQKILKVVLDLESLVNQLLDTVAAKKLVLKGKHIEKSANGGEDLPSDEWLSSTAEILKKHEDDLTANEGLLREREMALHAREIELLRLEQFLAVERHRFEIPDEEEVPAEEPTTPAEVVEATETPTTAPVVVVIEEPVTAMSETSTASAVDVIPSADGLDGSVPIDDTAVVAVEAPVGDETAPVDAVADAVADAAITDAAAPVGGDVLATDAEVPADVPAEDISAEAPVDGAAPVDAAAPVDDASVADASVEVPAAFRSIKSMRQTKDRRATK